MFLLYVSKFHHARPCSSSQGYHGTSGHLWSVVESSKIASSQLWGLLDIAFLHGIMSEFANLFLNKFITLSPQCSVPVQSVHVSFVIPLSSVDESSKIASCQLWGLLDLSLLRGIMSEYAKVSSYIFE